MAKLLKINVPVDPQIIQSVMIVALIVGILAFLLRHRSTLPQIGYNKAQLADIKHDMSDLYKDRRISKKLAKGLRQLRRESKTLDEHPEEANGILLQLKRILPAERWLTQRMAQLREKAYKIRHGHIARSDETRNVFAKLPTSSKKKASWSTRSRQAKLARVPI